MSDKEAGAQLRPRDELQTQIDGLVSAFMGGASVQVRDLVSALSEAAERLRDDKIALEGIAIHGRGVQGINGARAVASKALGLPYNATAPTPTSDPKEALERLSKGLDAWCKYSGAVTFPGDADVRISDIRTLIAEREGLDREVERLKLHIHEINTEAGKDLLSLDRRAKAAEAKLSAMEEACKPFADICVGRESFGDEVEIDIRLVSPRLNVSRARLLMKEFRAIRALLHPTVSVETTWTYTQAEVDSILKAAFPKVSVAPPSQGTEIKAAYKQGWNDREGDLIAGVNRLGVPAESRPDVTELVEAAKELQRFPGIRPEVGSPARAAWDALSQALSSIRQTGGVG